MNNSYIALLRGINVGGHKKFPKAEQLEMLSTLGLKNPKVYIHTGNWVFKSSKNAIQLKSLITETILKKYGWNVPVIVVKAKEFHAIFENCPFDQDKKERSYFTLFGSPPSPQNIKQLKALQYINEEFYVTPTCIYTYYKQGAGKAKFTNNVVEKKLNISATSRNYNTMNKIIAISID